MLRSVALSLVVAAAAIATTAAAAPAPAAPDDGFLVRDVTLFDGERVVAHASVLVLDGVVRFAGPASDRALAALLARRPVALEVDGRGKFLMPGLMDAEAHVRRPSDYLLEILRAERDDRPVCGAKPATRGVLLRPSIGALFAELTRAGLLVEQDTHGLYYDHDRLSGGGGKQRGETYPLSEQSNMEKHLRFGVTTIFDMMSDPSFTGYFRRSRGATRGSTTDREADDRHREFLLYPDTFSSGTWAAPARLNYFGFGADPVYDVAPDGPWTAREIAAWVGRRVVQGSDYVKVYYDDKERRPGRPRLSAATLRALVKAARARKLPVVSHVLSIRELGEALDAGVTGTMHTPVRGGVVLDDATAARAARTLRFNVPTLGVLNGACDNPYAAGNVRTHVFGGAARGASFTTRVLESKDVLPYVNPLDELRVLSCDEPDDGSESFEGAFRNAAKLADAGVPLLTGTDSGSAEPSLEGASLAYEAYLIAEALKRYSTRFTGEAANLYALKAMTSFPARAFGLDREDGHRPREAARGFVRPGYRADLVLLRADPVVDVLNALAIDAVWKGGQRVERRVVRERCEDPRRCASRAIVNRAWARDAAACRGR
jgi:imidazolonepropionase-like amidohydrolase